VDTFSGVIQEDIEYEVAKRKKKRDFYFSSRVNKKKWFDWTMQYNNVNRVYSLEVDVNKYDFKTLAPLSFALLDVDLYGPMKNSLPRLYDVLSPGGIIVCDDCSASDVRWDGANQAYSEFMQEIGQPVQVMHGKLGIIKK
jgi:O-methyltransferase